MATWNSRGLRGSALEEYINRTNEKYLENHLALIQKKMCIRDSDCNEAGTGDFR